LKTAIPNAAEETGVPETLSSEEDSTNIPQEGLIQENPTTAQQDLMTSQAILHSFLNTLTYASPGNNNIMSTN
jgi:hypothetical protein